MSNSNRGGARPGAGRPRLKVVKAPDVPDAKWFLFHMPESMWQEFKDASRDALVHNHSIAYPPNKEPQEEDYMRLADLVLIDSIHRYIKSKKRAKKKAKE
jgi:hypothetical protein